MVSRNINFLSPRAYPLLDKWAFSIGAWSSATPLGERIVVPKTVAVGAKKMPQSYSRILILRGIANWLRRIRSKTLQ